MAPGKENNIKNNFQIRCMVAILFLIGKKLEEPSIIDELYDLEKYPGMPQ
jgi:tRNA pseudouridine38/39 synthase